MYCTRRLEIFAGPAGTFLMTSRITAGACRRLMQGISIRKLSRVLKVPPGLSQKVTHADDAHHCTSIAPLSAADAPAKTASAPAKTARVSRRDFSNRILFPLFTDSGWEKIRPTGNTNHIPDTGKVPAGLFAGHFGILVKILFMPYRTGRLMQCV